MARKTPDFTAQARQTRRRKAQRMPPMSRYMAWSCYGSLVGGSALFVWGLTMSAPGLGSGGADARASLIGTIGALAGIALNLLVLLLTLYATDPKRHPLRAINKTTLIYGIIFTGVTAAVITLASNVGQAIFGPGLIPPVAVFTFICRPRLKALAIAEGRYTKSRGEQKREEWEKQRAQEKAEKQAYEELKRQRLGGPAAAGAAAGRKTSSGGSGRSSSRGSGRSGAAKRSKGSGGR